METMKECKNVLSETGESMERMLKSVCDIYREIEELQENINSIYEKAKIKMNSDYECEEDKEFDKDYFECIKSYVRN